MEAMGDDVKEKYVIIQEDHVSLPEDDAEEPIFGYFEMDSSGNTEYIQYYEATDDVVDAQENKLETEDCDLISHKVILYQRSDNNKSVAYYCVKCEKEYETIEEFANLHCIKIQDVDSEAGHTIVVEDGLCSVKAHDEGAQRPAQLNLNDSASQQLDGQISYPIETLEYQSYEPNLVSDDQQENGDKYYCMHCEKLFDTLETAELHECNSLKSIFKTSRKQPEDDAKHFYCESCNEDFATLLFLRKHEIDCASNDVDRIMYVCTTCGKRYRSEKSLNYHKRTHQSTDISESGSPGRPHCDICNTTFSSQKCLKLHMKIHDKRKLKSIQQALPEGAKMQYNELNQFYCEICNKSFEQNLLEIHKNMHQKYEEYICHTCNRRFENLPSYEVHIQIHTQSSKPRTQQRKDSAETAKLHYKCQYCGHGFARPHDKVKHERVHTGEKPYECEVCGKKFRVAYSLTLHLRTHTNVRPYVCATCNKRYKSQTVYAHHLRTHDEECAYKCNECSKAFRTSVQLCAHKNIHKKPFTCPECNRPFASLYYVKLHMKTHMKADRASENLKYRCSICGAVYARIYALRVHLKDKHGMTVDDNDSHMHQLKLNCADVAGDVNYCNEEVKHDLMISDHQDLEGTKEEIVIHDFQGDEVDGWLNKYIALE